MSRQGAIRRNGTWSVAQPGESSFDDGLAWPGLHLRLKAYWKKTRLSLIWGVGAGVGLRTDHDRLTPSTTGARREVKTPRQHGRHGKRDQWTGRR